MGETNLWLHKLIRKNFISANPPAEMESIALEVTTTLESGEVVRKLVRLDLASGDVETIGGSLQVTDSDQVLPVVELDIRGTIAPSD